MEMTLNYSGDFCELGCDELEGVNGGGKVLGCFIIGCAVVAGGILIGATIINPALLAVPGYAGAAGAILLCGITGGFVYTH